MRGDFVEAIAGLAQRAVEPKPVTIGGVEFATAQVVDVRKADPTPAPLKLATLEGLVGYLTRNVDGLAFAEHVLHVASPDTVSLVSKTRGYHHQRDAHVVANAQACQVPWGRWLEHQEAMILLQSQFVRTDELASLLQALGNIREEAVKTVEDDGVSQQVTSKAGLHLVREVVLPPVVLLAPWRTFREVEQPASGFLLRLQRREGAMPNVALWESDGGAWRLEAVKRVAAWLREALAVKGLAALTVIA